MNTYLFVWNPKKWDWAHLEETIDQLEQTGRVSEQWSCSSYKSIRPGDRAFLLKLGTSPKGIIGSGFISTEPFLAKHWSGENRLVPRVILDFEVLLNPNKDPILTLDILNQGKLIKQNWTPQSSGISISNAITDELEAVWFDFLTTQKIRYNPFNPTEKEEQRVYTEGTPNQVILTKYERNPFARKMCIEHYGLSCIVCNFNFEESYGEFGKDFIHVHHLTQISKIAHKYEVDPIKDLRPVCPNCHAIIHRRKAPYSIDEMKKIRLN